MTAAVQRFMFHTGMCVDVNQSGSMEGNDNPHGEQSESQIQDFSKMKANRHAARFGGTFEKYRCSRCGSSNVEKVGCWDGSVECQCKECGNQWATGGM